MQKLDCASAVGRKLSSLRYHQPILLSYHIISEYSIDFFFLCTFVRRQISHRKCFRCFSRRMNLTAKRELFTKPSSTIDFNLILSFVFRSLNGYNGFCGENFNVSHLSLQLIESRATFKHCDHFPAFFSNLKCK